MKTERILKIYFENEEIDLLKDICVIAIRSTDIGCTWTTSLNEEESPEQRAQRIHYQKMQDLVNRIKSSIK